MLMDDINSHLQALLRSQINTIFERTQGDP